MAGDVGVIESVSRHIERRIGRIAMVFHEIVSDELHIDVFHVRSSFCGQAPGGSVRYADSS